jgi:hypothetical protein
VRAEVAEHAPLTPGQAADLGEYAGLDPGLLLYAVFALSSWWFATPPVARTLLDGTPAADATASRRAALVDLVNRLAAPRAGT